MTCSEPVARIGPTGSSSVLVEHPVNYEINTWVFAAQRDRVRWDMAKLMMNDLFERARGVRGGVQPETDDRPTVIAVTHT